MLEDETGHTEWESKSSKVVMMNKLNLSKGKLLHSTAREGKYSQNFFFLSIFFLLWNALSYIYLADKLSKAKSFFAFLWTGELRHLNDYS